MRVQPVMKKLSVLLLLCLITSSVILAADLRDSVFNAPRVNLRVVHEHGPFDIARSTQFFNSQCLTTVDCLNFPLATPVKSRTRIGPRPDKRSVDEKIADAFMTMTAYPGGQLLYNTVRAGLELLVFSDDLTTIRYSSNLKIGSNIRDFGKGKKRGGLKTGIFYNF